MKRRGLAGLVLALALALVVVGWRIWRTGNEVEVLADRLVEARQIAAEPCIRLGHQLREAIETMSSSTLPPREGGWISYYENGLQGAEPWIKHCAADRERAGTLLLALLLVSEDTDKDPLLAVLRELQTLVSDAPGAP